MNKDCSSSMISTIFLLLLSFTCSVISQSDSCSTLLSVSNLIPFNTSSLTCVAAWNSEGFILRYAKAGPRLWSFVLSAPDSGTYVAIGFTPNGRMVGSSAVVGWVPGGGGAVVAKQYSLGGYSSSQCPPDQGDLPLVQRSSVLVSKHSRVYLAFQLGTVQPQQNLIYAVGPAGTLPSAGGYLSAHRNMASDTLAAPAAGGGGGGEGSGEGSENGGEEAPTGRSFGGGSGGSSAGGHNPVSLGSDFGLSSPRKHGLLMIIALFLVQSFIC
ncbi:cytochrome b561 and DOMON domain-containing protein At3g07570-like isoform X1 [Zingiber officinale]|uniref:cytochrome b561 and DOMON domain-containing protein At3g07570-like isoform X1 n=1 Tax=Zingiber officinale TaxID=94328 RepID=UPI001C4CA21D|nr:cytochrome b561 and DOMON domain-containing protein At3g07570-like isoform X1 [Zingiber officinale]